MIKTKLSCHQFKIPVPGLGFIQLSSWLRGSHGSLQTTEAIAKKIGCFSQTDIKDSLLKMTLTELIDLGKDEMVLIWNLHHRSPL